MQKWNFYGNRSTIFCTLHIIHECNSEVNWTTCLVPRVVIMSNEIWIWLKKLFSTLWASLFALRSTLSLKITSCNYISQNCSTSSFQITKTVHFCDLSDIIINYWWEIGCYRHAYNMDATSSCWTYAFFWLDKIELMDIVSLILTELAPGLQQ